MPVLFTIVEKAQIHYIPSNSEMVKSWLLSEATVKRFFKENGHFRLQPENDSYEPIIVEEAVVLGKVVALHRYY